MEEEKLLAILRLQRSKAVGDILAKRMIAAPRRATRLIKCMKQDSISFPDNIQLLKKHLIKYVGDVKFKDCENMGEILETILDFVKRNYLDISNKELF